MRIRHAAAVAIALVAVAACNGDDDSATSTVVTAPITTVVETTVPETTQPSTTTETTAPPTTEATAATTSTTEATTPPTNPTTTSPDDGATDMIAVVEAVELAWQSSLDALRDPTSDVLRERLGVFYTGTLLEGFQNLVDSHREQNYRTIENPEEPDSLDVELASIAVNEAGTFATVQACDVTSGILVEVGVMADGSDRVVDDRIGRVVIEFEVVRVDGVWKVENGRAPEESERIASCE